VAPAFLAGAFFHASLSPANDERGAITLIVGPIIIEAVVVGSDNNGSRSSSRVVMAVTVIAVTVVVPSCRERRNCAG
jgi:hypothetical protein